MEIDIENALPAGHELRQYRIVRPLGGGGFSIVYLAHDTAQNRPVVIKEYLPGNQAKRTEDVSVQSLSAETNTTFKQGIKRFFEEAAILAKIRHESIVQVIDFFRDNNTVYIVMQYEHGKDLRSYVKRYRRLPEKFIRAVFSGVLLGLRELHGHNLLHLDIKPANIFLRPGGKPLLLDFGAAQPAYRENRVQAPHTLTLGYAPIEQHRRGHLGPWTDLYAIGASMWTCMSGKAPLAAPKRNERDRLKPAVKQFARHYSRHLLEAVDWCLRMDQLERPQNAQQLIDYLAREPVPDIDPPASLLGRLGFSWLAKRAG